MREQLTPGVRVNGSPEATPAVSLWAVGKAPWAGMVHAKGAGQWRPASRDLPAFVSVALVRWIGGDALGSGQCDGDTVSFVTLPLKCGQAPVCSPDAARSYKIHILFHFCLHLLVPCQYDSRSIEGIPGVGGAHAPADLFGFPNLDAGHQGKCKAETRGGEQQNR